MDDTIVRCKQSTLVDIFFTVSTALALYKLSESTFVDIPLTVST